MSAPTSAIAIRAVRPSGGWAAAKSEGRPVAPTICDRTSCGMAKAKKTAAAAARPATGRSSALRPTPRNMVWKGLEAIREPCL